MFLKLMSGIDAPDAAANKPYRLIECRQVNFQPGLPGGLGWACADGNMYELHGNAYILNANGKTIDSYWATGTVEQAPAAESTVVTHRYEVATPG